MYTRRRYTHSLPTRTRYTDVFSVRCSIVAAVALLTSSGCASKETHDSLPPDIRGTVTGVITANGQMRDRGVIGFLRVEGKRDTGLRYDRADVTITDTTLIYERSGESLSAIGFGGVHEGDTVEANFVGPVLERYPVHATAGRLVILR